MRARALHRGKEGAPRSIQGAFLGHIGSLVRGAEKDPYVGNFLRRRDSRMVAYAPPISFSGRERNPLFHNRGDGTFVEIGSAIGISRIEDGRGMVVADLDGDGDGDVVVHNYYKNPLVVLRNDVRDNAPTITVRLRGTKSNRFGIGARVRAEEGARVQVQELAAGTGFLTGNPPELYFAVGEKTTLRVRWPSGLEQVFADVPSRKTVTITEGDGRAKIEARRPTTFGGEEAVPPAPLREGDLWPGAVPLPSASGPRVVVLFRIDCLACGEELKEWRRWEKLAAPGSLSWVSLDADPRRVRGRLQRAGILISLAASSPAARGLRLAALVPTVFVVDPSGRIRAKFVGPGSVEAALSFPRR